MAVIILVGVAHVIDLKSQIERIIMEENPDIVAVELDYGRYLAMVSKEEGEMPYIYRKMAEMQKNLAEMFGGEVGAEMLTAVNTAKLMGKRVAFIDMDSRRIMENIKREMGPWEKFKLYSSIIFAPFLGRRMSRKEVESIIENEEEVIREIRKRYPGLARALFDKREEHMASKLLSMEGEDVKILAFVGDGHVDGLKRRIPAAKTVRLKDMLGDTRGFSYTLRF